MSERISLKPLGLSLIVELLCICTSKPKHKNDSSPTVRFWPIAAMHEEPERTTAFCESGPSELMPTDACQFFYECEGCGKLLNPLDGDC